MNAGDDRQLTYRSISWLRSRIDPPVYQTGSMIRSGTSLPTDNPSRSPACAHARARSILDLKSDYASTRKGINVETEQRNELCLKPVVSRLVSLPNAPALGQQKSNAERKRDVQSKRFYGHTHISALFKST